MSVLKGYKNSEAGLSGGVGVGGGSPFAWHVGLEYKKYINSNIEIIDLLKMLVIMYSFCIFAP